MFDVKIYNDTLPKQYISNVSFPNCSDICGDVPKVGMIYLSTGQALFDVNDIIYAITEFPNGVHGLNNLHVRKIVTTRGGFGTVAIFRRGGVYANISALHSIAKHFFDSSAIGAAYCRIERPSVYQSLMNCEVNQYTNMSVAAELQFPVDKLVTIVPSTLAVTMKGVFGAPIPSDTGEPSTTVEQVPEAATTADEQADASTASSEVDASITAPIPGISGITALLTQLVSGKKLVITVSLE